MTKKKRTPIFADRADRPTWSTIRKRNCESFMSQPIRIDYAEMMRPEKEVKR